MLAYTPVTESGGVAKTTTAATLAVAHARAGYDVLMVDLDSQNGSLSYLLDVDDDTDNSDADNVVRHMVGRPKGDFDDLIRTTEAGVDVIPNHAMLEDLGDILNREKEQAESMGEAYSKYHQLHQMLKQNDVPENYDVLIVDSDGRPGPHLYNALVAVRNVVITLQCNAKGEQSLEGLDELVDGLEQNLAVDVSALAVLPIGYKDNHKEKRKTIQAIEAMEFNVPVKIGDREAMVDGAWRNQCSLFEFVEEHRDRQRDREVETLEKHETLARHLEKQAGLSTDEPEVTA